MADSASPTNSLQLNERPSTGHDVFVKDDGQQSFTHLVTLGRYALAVPPGFVPSPFPLAGITPFVVDPVPPDAKKPPVPGEAHHQPGLPPAQPSLAPPGSRYTTFASPHPLPPVTVSVPQGDKDTGTEVSHGVPRVVEIHVTFKRIGEVNMLRECYKADLFISAIWREPLLDGSQYLFHEKLSAFWNPNLFIENILTEPQTKTTTSVEYDENLAFIVENRNIQGTFVETFNLQRFPFDCQPLSLVLKSNKLSHEVTLKDNNMLPHKVNRKWFFNGDQFQLLNLVESDELPPYQEEIGQELSPSNPGLVLKCWVARKFSFYIVNAFLIVFIISLCGLSIFLVDFSTGLNRMQMIYTCTLASIAYKKITSNYAPRPCALTYVEKYHVLNIAFLITEALWHGFQEMNLDYLMKIWGQPLIDVVGSSLLTIELVFFNLLFIWFFLKANLIRSHLKGKEALYSSHERLDTPLDAKNV